MNQSCVAGFCVAEPLFKKKRLGLVNRLWKEAVAGSPDRGNRRPILMNQFCVADFCVAESLLKKRLWVHAYKPAAAEGDGGGKPGRENRRPILMNQPCVADFLVAELLFKKNGSGNCEPATEGDGGGKPDWGNRRPIRLLPNRLFS